MVLTLFVSQLTFVRAEASEELPTAKFADVADENKYYYKPVYWAASKNITTGRTAADDSGQKIFDPSATCIRREVVTFLWRLAGCPDPESMESPFADVTNPDVYYYKPVLWAAEQGITRGRATATEDGGIIFDHSATCTRREIVTFLYRFAGSPAISSTSPFSDVTNPEAYYYNAVTWAYENHITSGKTGTDTFDPYGECSRAMTVTFLYRFARSTDTIMEWWGADENGNVGFGYTGFAVGKNGTYYVEDGARVDTTEIVKDDNNWYNLDEGRLVGGWSQIDGDYYFLDRTSGVLQTSLTKNQIEVDQYGKAVMTDYAEEKIPVMIRAKDLVHELTEETDDLVTKEKKCLAWVNQYPYLVKDVPLANYMDRYACYPAHYANNILNAYGDQRVIGGQCTAEAAATGFLLLELEVENLWLVNGTNHSWLQTDTVYIDPYYYKLNGSDWLNHSLPHPYYTVNKILL